MNRLLFVFVVSAIAIAGYAMYSNNDLGLMQVSFAGNHYQANLLEVGVGLLAVLLAVLLLSYAFGLFKNFTRQFAEKRLEQRIQKARQSLERGVIELAEGRHARAEKILLRQIEHTDNAMFSYLAAARAAQYQGAFDRRDDYIRLAHDSAPDADIAIGLTQAEMQMDYSQYEMALATLTHLNALTPLHAQVLKLLAETYRKLADWENLRELLPDVKKAGAFSDERLLSLEIDTWCGLISSRGRTGDIDMVTQFWEVLPREIKVNASVVEYYAAELIKLHASGEAEQVLRDYLSTNWVESTVVLYSELDVMATEEQLATAENWLRHHQQNEHLLYALGKMCISKDMWQQARNYLEASLSARPMPATYLKLAQLLEDHLEDRRQAQDYYRQGLHMLCGDYGEEALANAENDFQRVIMKPELKVI